MLKQLRSEFEQLAGSEYSIMRSATLFRLSDDWDNV